MAKIQKKYSFKDANISFDEGKYIITEISNDSSVDYNLSDILNEFLNLDNATLTISVESEPNGLE